jgi:hypothetical protein
MKTAKVITRLTDSLPNQGFTAIIQHSQKFNVICITKYSLDNERSIFHLSPDGSNYRYDETRERVKVEIEVKHILFTRADISITQTVVNYQGRDYPVEGTRKGLSGKVLVIGIYNEDQEGFGVWHLYTDTPTKR